MRVTNHSFRRSLWCVLLFILGSVRPASAARLLEAFVAQDGEVVIHTYYQDEGRADAATVWRYLAEPPIMVDDDVTNIETTSEDLLSAALTGNLLIRIQHGDRIIARSQLARLMLRRADPQTQAWFLPEEEVERTAVVAGLGPPQPPVIETLLGGYVATIATALLILVGCIVVTFVLLRGPRTISPD